MLDAINSLIASGQLGGLLNRGQALGGNPIGRGMQRPQMGGFGSLFGMGQPSANMQRPQMSGLMGGLFGGGQRPQTPFMQPAMGGLAGGLMGQQPQAQPQANPFGFLARGSNPNQGGFGRR